MRPRPRYSLGLIGALALVLAPACEEGTDSTSGPDAAVPGKTDDGVSSPDASLSGMATVIVSGWFEPEIGPTYLADVPVLIYHPDGTLASAHKTDLTGRVSAIVDRGGTVVVINTYPTAAGQVEAAIVSPGDTLRFGPDVDSRVPVGQLHVTWPARVIPGYATYYTVVTACGVTTTMDLSATLPLYQGCAPGPFDVVVTSRRSSQETTGVMTRRNVMPGANVTVALADNGATWNIASTHSVPLINSPNAGQQPSTSCRASQLLGTMAINSTAATAPYGTDCAMRLLPGSDTMWSVEAMYERNGDQYKRLGVRQVFPHDMITPLDAAEPLPWITSLSYDAATREVAWTSEQPTTADASTLRIDVPFPRALAWRIYAPNGLPPTWRLPTLPAEHAQVDLIATDAPRVSLNNIDVVGLSASELLQSSIYYDYDYGYTTTFADKAVRSASAFAGYPQ